MSWKLKKIVFARKKELVKRPGERGYEYK